MDVVDNNTHSVLEQIEGSSVTILKVEGELIGNKLLKLYLF